MTRNLLSEYRDSHERARTQEDSSRKPPPTVLIFTGVVIVSFAASVATIGLGPDALTALVAGYGTVGLLTWRLWKRSGFAWILLVVASLVGLGTEIFATARTSPTTNGIIDLSATLLSLVLLLHSSTRKWAPLLPKKVASPRGPYPE